MRSGWRRSTRLSSSASITPLLSRASRSSRAPLSLVVRWPLSSTRTEPLHEGVQVDRLSPIADGSLGSGSWRNTLNFQEDTIHYLRFQAGLMNKAGSGQLLNATRAPWVALTSTCRPSHTASTPGDDAGSSCNP